MGFGTTNTVIGKQQKSFFLETEMTAIKMPGKVGAVASYPFEAGSIIKVDPSDGIVKQAADTDTVSTAKYGVAFETHTATLDECAATGLVTVLWGQHVARTLQYDTTKTYIPGEKLYIGASGKFTNDGTLQGGANVHVGYVEGIQGPWLKYSWTTPNNEA